MNYVIECCKYHQHQNNCETYAETHLLGSFGQWTAAQRLD